MSSTTNHSSSSSSCSHSASTTTNNEEELLKKVVDFFASLAQGEWNKAEWERELDRLGRELITQSDLKTKEQFTDKHGETVRSGMLDAFIKGSDKSVAVWQHAAQATSR